MSIQETLPEFLYRHRVKAGLTGYAQITGKYNTSSKDKLVMDLMNIESFSIWNDVKILFQTVLCSSGRMRVRRLSMMMKKRSGEARASSRREEDARWNRW